MTRKFITPTAVVAILVSATALAGGTRPVVKSPDESKTVEATAAEELSDFLKLIYSEDEFPVVSNLPERGDYVLVGTRESVPLLAELVGPGEVDEDGEFVVKHVQKDGRTIGVICGADSRAVLDGVYRFLEAKLGICFYFNEAVWENKVTGPFDWALWEHSDKPLFPFRGVNGWHSFYGSPTTMDFEEWKDYLARVARTGINWNFIHDYELYGVRQFEFEGKKNSVRDVTSTRYGAEWSTRNVWDMRALPYGGQWFDYPVHGSDSCKEPTKEARIAREKQTYRDFIHYGKTHYGVQTWELLAMDNYGQGAIDQEQILALPESDRIFSKIKGHQHGGDRWVPNVDTPGGYAFVKAQVKQVIDDRPDLAGLSLQFRGVGVNPNCLHLTYEEMPENWQRQMDALYKTHPQLDASWDQRCYHFYHAKTANAFRRILDEIGRADIHSGIGWWSRPSARGGVESVRLMDAALDPRVFLTLGGHHQKGIEYKHTEFREAVQTANRGVIIIPYLQEDVRHIIGGTGVWHIEDELSVKALEMKLDGPAMSHFATRPTDLKQKYWINNMFEATREETHKSAEERFARDWFGKDAATAELIEYVRALSAFEGFGELCCNTFYDWGTNPLRFTNPKDQRNEIDRYRQAIELGERIERGKLSAMAKARLDYYQKYLDFARTMLEHSYAVHYKDTADQPADPFEVAKKFVAALEALPKHEWSRVHAIDKGQIAEIYGRFVRQVLWRQKAEGLYPHYGIKFAEIGNWDLGFNILPDGRAIPVGNGPFARIGRFHADTSFAKEDGIVDSYAETDQASLTYEAHGELGIGREGKIMPKGKYDVKIHFPAYITEGPGQRVVGIQVESGDKTEVDLFANGKKDQTIRLSDVEVTDGTLTVDFTKVKGPIAVSAVIASKTADLYPNEPERKPQAKWRFDFGSKGSPLADGHTQVSEQTDYRGDALGYGWGIATGLSSGDDPKSNDPINRDFVEARVHRTFHADVPDGDYAVTVTLDGSEKGLSKVNLIFEGEVRAALVNLKKGERYQETFPVKVADGRLDLGINSSGQWAALWRINALDILPLVPDRDGASTKAGDAADYVLALQR